MTALAVEDRDGARWIRLSRPPANVLDLDAIAELEGALRSLADRKDVKAVVLASAVPGVFSGGVDVRDHEPAHVPAMLTAFHGLLLRLDRLPQPVIAAVDGPCLGGGCELAAFCDVVLATPRSIFGQPEIDVGCFPPGASVVLPRIAGRAAAEMILTGRPIPATEAFRIGLVSRVVEDVEAEAARLAADFRSKSAPVLSLARRAVRHGAEGPVAEALAAAETIYRDELMKTQDALEGVKAFLEKRRPAWRDE